MSEELDITGTEAAEEAGNVRGDMGVDAATTSADAVTSESVDGTEPSDAPAEPVDDGDVAVGDAGDDEDAVAEPTPDTDTVPDVDAEPESASEKGATAGDADDAHGDDARDGTDGDVDDGLADDDTPDAEDADGADVTDGADEGDGEATEEAGEKPTTEKGVPEGSADDIPDEPEETPIEDPAVDDVPEDDDEPADNQNDGFDASEEPDEAQDEYDEAPDGDEDADHDDIAETDETEDDADAVDAESAKSEDAEGTDGASEGTDGTETSSDDDGDASDDAGDSVDADDIKDMDDNEAEGEMPDGETGASVASDVSDEPDDADEEDDASVDDELPASTDDGTVTSDEDADGVVVGDEEPLVDADEDSDDGDGSDGFSDGKPIDFMPDLESDEFREYSERALRKRPIVAIPHVMVALVGVLLACLFLALPFALDRAVSDADDALVAQVEGAFDKMGDKEREHRLALAQRHNALVSGWDAWPLVGDNDGKVGGDGSTSDDVWDSDGGVPDAPSDAEIEANRPLDVGDGLIGWISVPTGRKVAVCDSSALLDGKANVLRHERWSEWPVGGHGTTCVLSLDDTENADSVVEDLLGLTQGDEIVLSVLGDSYAYKVDGIDSGTATSVMERISKQRVDDALDILVQRGSVTRIVTAHRVRFSGTHGEGVGITSPSVRWHLVQMVMALVIGIASSVAFVITWRAGRKAEESDDGQPKAKGGADDEPDQQGR